MADAKDDDGNPTNLRHVLESVRNQLDDENAVEQVDRDAVRCLDVLRASATMMMTTRMEIVSL